MTIKEMLEKRAKCVADARAIFDAAKNEKRDPTAEEQKQFDALMKESDELKAQADEAQANLNREKKLAEVEDSMSKSRGRQTEHQTTDEKPKAKTFKFANGQVITLTGDRASDEYRDAFNRFMVTGTAQNALQADSDTAGGYTVPSIWNANRS